MDRLVLIVLGVEKAMRAKRHGYAGLWADGKLLRCARMAGSLGWLNWERS